METSTRKNLIQSVERALNILETVRNAQTPIRAIDIARIVGLSSTAANNIVRTLYIRGYLKQDEQGRYMLGIQSYLLSTAADAWSDLRLTAKESMSKLSRNTGCLTFFGIEAHEQIIAIDIAESMGPVIVPLNQDWLDQFHSTAAGKILLAAMSPEKYIAFKAHYKLQRFTEKTIMDWDTLDKQIEESRCSGYSVCHDESVFGITSIAVPVKIYSENNIKIAALAAVFSSYYLNPKYQEDILKHLNKAALEISKKYNSLNMTSSMDECRYD